jgi:hypothetical protein
MVIEVESESIYERIKKILFQNVITVKFGTSETNFFPDITIMVQKDDSQDKLVKLRKNLLKIGFEYTLSEIDKKEVLGLLNAGKEEINKQLPKTASGVISNNPNRSVADSLTIASNMIDSSTPYLDIKNYNSLFVFYSLKLTMIDPQKFKDLNPARGGTVMKKSFFPKKTGMALASIMTAIIAIVCIYGVIYAIAYDTPDEDIFSIFSHMFNEGDTIVYNIIYFMLGIICYFLVREISHYIVFKIKKISYTPSYFIGFEDVSNKNGRPNHQFDLAIVRIISGFVFSIFLLCLGFYLSVLANTATLDVPNEDFSENLNRYNLLTLLIKYIFFPDPAVFAIFESEYSLPQTVILMHPLAYAGFFSSLLSLFTTIPMGISDGGKILYAATRKTNIICATSILAGIALGILFPMGIIFVMLIVMLGISGSVSKTVRFEDTQYPMYQLSKRRKIIGLILIITFCILLFPLSPHTNFMGFAF